MQFRVLSKITLHKQHVMNVFNSSDSQFLRLNRHKDILPYTHNRVILKERPFLDAKYQSVPSSILMPLEVH